MVELSAAAVGVACTDTLYLLSTLNADKVLQQGGTTIEQRLELMRCAAADEVRVRGRAARVAVV